MSVGIKIFIEVDAHQPKPFRVVAKNAITNEYVVEGARRLTFAEADAERDVILNSLRTLS